MRNEQPYPVIISAIILAVLLAAPALAQTQSQLSGTVMDNSGAVVVGAAVTLRNTSTGVAQTVQSNESGIYSFPFVQPGPYELSCELQGFKKSTQTGIVMETGAVRKIDLRLEVGAVTESMTVVASSPILDADTSSVGQFIERTTVANMPVESRRVASLVRLMGGVVFRQEQQGEAIPYFAIAGGRGGNQMWNLDGAVIQNMTLGVPVLTMNPPAESLQEFKAETNAFSAEFGRAGGGMILMTTRSGTNQYHGSLYEFLRNDKLDARSFFARSKAPLRYNVFGGSIGGPIRKDRTFIFGNFEAARRRDGQTISDTIVPNPPERLGDFSNRRDLTLIDPVNRQPFPGNVIPRNRLDPVGQALAQFYPDPNANFDITRAPVNNYLANVSDKMSQNSITARLDHIFNDNNRLYVRFNYIVSFNTFMPVYPQAAMDFRAKQQDNDNTAIMGSWIRNIKPNLINELRLNYNLRSNTVIPAGAESNLNQKIGLAGVDQSRAPRANVAGHTALGLAEYRLQLPIVTRQVIDTVTWIKGRHQIKTGFEFRFSMNQDINKPSAGGTFGFLNRATNNGLAELLLGWTNSVDINSTDILASRSDFWGAFIQDDWKITPKLTLNLGLRWDMDTPRWVRENRQSGFDGKPINPVSGTPGIVTFAGLDGTSKYANDFDKNNFAPRVGFAYRVNDRTVLRGGYGIAYNGIYAIATPFILTNGFGVTTNIVSSDGGFTPPFLLRSGVPDVPRQALGPGFGAVPVGQTPRLTPGYFQKDHMNGYAQQWNLTVQRQLAGNMLLEVSYIANAGRKLSANTNIDINQIPLVNGRGPARQDQRLRPFPQFSGVTWYGPPIGTSSYNSLNVKVEKRFSGGLNFMSNFTWSKFLDNVFSGSELGGNPTNYQHMELLSLNKSMSGNDIPKRWISSMVYELPFGKGRHWGIENPIANGILGGWGLGLIAEFRDGPPWGAIEQTNTSNTYSQGQRPNVSRNPILASGRPRSEFISQYFDTTAFSAPETGTFGNAARNLGYSPGFIGIDTSIHKNWKIGERTTVQFRTDFFNMPNRPNFGVPAMQRGRADFGRITGVILNSQRILQMSMRLEF